MPRLAHAAAVVTAAVAIVFASGCAGTIVQPGHRGLMFDPKEGGLKHEVLQPGYYSLRSCFMSTVCSRIDDFDVTYATKKETIEATTSEGLPASVTVAVTYRPIIAELYELDAQIGPHYYDEVVAPELKSVARLSFARHSALELSHATDKLEADMETVLRKRLQGTHVEIASVTVDSFKYPPKVEPIVVQMLVDHAGKTDKSDCKTP
jgi:hypothetical protein